MNLFSYFVIAFIVVMTLTWFGARLLGTILWRKCVKCKSRYTRTTKGWVPAPTQQMTAEFVQDTECDCCHHRQRQLLPRNMWSRGHSS